MKLRLSMGFGLVELMVAVAVIAILAVVSVPAFDRFFSAGRLDGALHEVTAALNLARTTAISRSKAVSVMILPGSNWCVVAGIPTTTKVVEDGAVKTASIICSCSADCSSCSNCEIISKVKASDHDKVQLNSTLPGYVIDPANGIVTRTGQIGIITGSREGRIGLGKLGKAWICGKGTDPC